MKNLRIFLIAAFLLLLPATQVLAHVDALRTSAGTSSAAQPLVIPNPPKPKAAAAQTITFAQPADAVLGTAPYQLVASASSKLPVSFASTTAPVCTVTPTGIVTLVSAGNCSITATQAGQAAKFKAATPVTRTFAVKLSQSLTFTLSSASITFGDVAPTITATSSRGLPITFTSTTTAVCTVSGSPAVITVISAGTCSVTASQAGNPTIAAATSVVASFVVSPRPQTITFNQPGPVAPDAGSVSLIASAAPSGLPVSFTATPASVCTVSGNTLTLVGVAGNCVVTASQAGNGGNASATPVTRTINVRFAQTIWWPLVVWI